MHLSGTVPPGRHGTGTYERGCYSSKFTALYLGCTASAAQCSFRSGVVAWCSLLIMSVLACSWLPNGCQWTTGSRLLEACSTEHQTDARSESHPQVIAAAHECRRVPLPQTSGRRRASGPRLAQPPHDCRTTATERACAASEGRLVRSGLGRGRSVRGRGRHTKAHSQELARLAFFFVAAGGSNGGRSRRRSIGGKLPSSLARTQARSVCAGRNTGGLSTSVLVRCVRACEQNSRAFARLFRTRALRAGRDVLCWAKGSRRAPTRSGVRQRAWTSGATPATSSRPWLPPRRRACTLQATAGSCHRAIGRQLPVPCPCPPWPATAGLRVA
jgi:hypothetical protein